MHSPPCFIGISSPVGTGRRTIFSLDLYAYYLARSRGLAVKRFPVRFGERAHGTSHWNVNWAAKRKFIKRTIAFSLELKRSTKP